MASILSHGQTTSGQCGFNQAASHPADPIKRHRARRERSHPKAMLTTQTSAVALDLLENSIGYSETNNQIGGTSALHAGEHLISKPSFKHCRTDPHLRNQDCKLAPNIVLLLSFLTVFFAAWLLNTGVASSRPVEGPRNLSQRIRRG